MPIPVLLYQPSLNIKHTLERELIKNQYADGYVAYNSHEAAIGRANGISGLGTYKGLNHFSISYNRTLKGVGKLADYLWTFFITRLDNLNEGFYFYNYPEAGSIDPTGVSTIGRYFVHLANPNQVLSRDYFKACLFSYSGIDLVEDRDLGDVQGSIYNAIDTLTYSDSVGKSLIEL